ncbi:hypothetical protein RAS1_21660 [Phycisphaerae bacterium RAS1]|nr:hypothetical protein RAS1_21660 [Phycisphaerae bacterium RAS1]
MTLTFIMNRVVLALVSLLVGLAGTSFATAETAREKFYQAYYAQREKGDLTLAAKLYGETVAAKDADAALKSDAQARLAACREDLATSDFTKLLPMNCLAYVELNRPGEQVIRLLDQLGLLAKAESIAADVAAKGGPQIAVRPGLVRELLGIRGIAAAVTGFDPTKQMPTGVLILHPGDQEIVRGLIETALPAAAAPAEPIKGCPTFKLDDPPVLVTLSSRLVIVSMQANEIADVISRARGEEDESLASNPALAETLKGRQDALLFFCVNAKPIMPLINGALAAAAGEQRELAIAQALLDLKSFNSIVGNVGVRDDGLYLDLALHLEKGHRNLVYNFLRMPALDRESLKSIPEGVAAFFAMSLNEADSRFSSGGKGGGEAKAAGDGAPIVSFLDLGREFFANIVGVTACVLPPDGEATRIDGEIIPDAALMMTVNDPAKSAALWTELLGIASIASGGGVSFDGASEQIDGMNVRTYRMPEGVAIHYASAGNTILITPSKSAITRIATARKSGKSVAGDPAFAAAIKQIRPENTIAAFVHVGRCAQIGRQYMADDELREAEPFMNAMSDTVGSLLVEHSGEALRLTMGMSGLPKLGGIVAKLIQENRHDDDGGDGDGPRHAGRSPRKAAQLQQSFLQSAAEAPPQEMVEVANLGDELFAVIRDDAKALNNVAWELLSEDKYGRRWKQHALRFSLRSNELSKFKDWRYLDTLALAFFQMGEINEAIAYQKKAMEACKGGDELNGLRKTLAHFESSQKSGRERD